MLFISALGGGAGLVAACDITISVESAVLGFTVLLMYL